MSLSRRVVVLLMGLLALVVPAAAAGPAAAQGTVPTVPGITTPGTATTVDPAGTSTTADPGATSPGGRTDPTLPEVTAAQAGPGILLEAEDRVELASGLAEATEETGVCFGYVVALSGGGASDRTETLSNAGPDRAPSGGTACPEGSLVLQVSLNYTSSSSEAEDSAGFGVISTVAGLSSAEATAQLRDLTGLDEGALLGDDDDLALRNGAAGLPLLLDDAPAAELTPATKAPNGDRLTGSPKSDWAREHGGGIAIAVLLLLVGIVLLVYGRRGRRRSSTPATGPSSTTIDP